MRIRGHATIVTRLAMEIVEVVTWLRAMTIAVQRIVTVDAKRGAARVRRRTVEPRPKQKRRRDERLRFFVESIGRRRSATTQPAG